MPYTLLVRRPCRVPQPAGSHGGHDLGAKACRRQV